MMEDYEGAAEIERAWREGLTPDPLLTVSEWSDRHRMLSSKASAEPGRWRTSRTPYLKAIMDCLSPTSPVERVVFMKAAQLGATEMGSNWIGYVIHHAPGPMMAVWPTVEMANNPATGVPYFRLPALGWGNGWATGNVLRFNTIGSQFPVWVVRTVQQGPESVPDDHFTLLIRGDVDTP